MPTALLSPSHILKGKKRKKNLFLCLWHGSKPEATKNGLSPRKACVTPVWPRCLPSPPSLLRRTQDLRRRGGKLIHSSWRQWLHVCVFSSSISFTHSINTGMHMLTNMHLNDRTFSLTCCPYLFVRVSHTNTNKGPQWNHLDSRLPFHQYP